MLSGTAGDDLIEGQAGDDQIFGNGGADVLDGGAGFDELFGGDGADHFVFRAGGDLDVVFDFQDGTDLVQVNGFTADQITVQAYGADSTEILGPGGERMILVGVDESLISNADFV